MENNKIQGGGHFSDYNYLVLISNVVFNSLTGNGPWGDRKKVGCYEKIRISVNFWAIAPRFGASPTMNQGLHFCRVSFFDWK